MSAGEKRREIAILLTMGMSRARIVLAFIFMGLFSGGFGALLGAAGGCAIAAGLTPITRGFQALTGIQLLNKDIYFIDFIPSQLNPGDAALVLLCALGMSVLSSLYPALRASAVNPARELTL